MEVGLGPRNFVFDGDPATPRKRAHHPHPILTHVYCGQTAGWIKMALGMEVGLAPGHIVLDGDPAPLPKKWAEPLPKFRPIFIVGTRMDASRFHLVWK